jgi:AcrR family transcriptional regulator
MDDYNIEINKLKIEKAAVNLFSHKAYRKVTMDEIAVEAGLTKRTIYRYFPSKAALLASLFEKHLQKINNEIMAAVDRCSEPGHALKEATKTLFNYTNNNQAFMKLFWMLSSDELDGEIPPELLQRIKLWNRNIIDQTISAAQGRAMDGILSKYPLESVSHFISAVNKGIFIHTNKERKLELVDLDSEQLQDMFLLFLDAALSKKE